MKNPRLKGTLTFDVELVPGQVEMSDLSEAAENAKQFGYQTIEEWQKGMAGLFSGLMGRAFVRRCPHDDKQCAHDCEGDECWREVNGS